jgi:hypothetical protein
MMVFLTALTATVYQLYGSTPETCHFVSELKLGYMSKGVRLLDSTDVTETLLNAIEAVFELFVIG